MKKSTIIMSVIFVIASVLFVVIPFPVADLFIRLHFDEINSETCSLYYSTDPYFSFSEEQCIVSNIDPETNIITFRVDSSNIGQITGLRLDFANAQDTVCVRNISVSSAGVIQKEYNPCVFFDANNILATNNTTFSLVNIQDLTYISTGDNDPYIIFTNEFTRDIMSRASSYRLTRALICAFVGIALILMKKKVFTEH